MRRLEVIAARKQSLPATYMYIYACASRRRWKTLELARRQVWQLNCSAA
jgi:hypothetical protein